MTRIRVASLQYFIRPVATFDQFRDQVQSLVETAVDYGCDLIVFPEYFTIQLLTLDDVKRPITEQIRTLAGQVPRYLELLGGLARTHRTHIVGGSIPTALDGQVYNTCYVFGPKGEHGMQAKLHLTRWEAEEWKVSPGDRLRVFEADFGRFAVNICYDVEFPEIARVAARHDAVAPLRGARGAGAPAWPQADPRRRPPPRLSPVRRPADDGRVRRASGGR